MILHAIDHYRNVTVTEATYRWMLHKYMSVISDVWGCKIAGYERSERILSGSGKWSESWHFRARQGKVKQEGNAQYPETLGQIRFWIPFLLRSYIYLQCRIFFLVVSWVCEFRVYQSCMAPRHEWYLASAERCRKVLCTYPAAGRHYSGDEFFTIYQIWRHALINIWVNWCIKYNQN